MPGAFVSVHFEAPAGVSLSICETFVYTDQVILHEDFYQKDYILSSVGNHCTALDGCDSSKGVQYYY